MNTLKPLLTVAVLAGIGYGVYVRINSGTGAPPAGVADGWDTAPKVQMGDAVAPAGSAPWAQGGVGAGQSVAPPFGAPVSSAPGVPVSPGGEAPPYNPPPVTTSAPPFAPPGATAAQLPPAGAPFGNQTPGAGISQDPMPPIPSTADPYAAAPSPVDAGVAPPSGAAPAVPVAVSEPGAADPYRDPAVYVAPVGGGGGIVVNYAAVMEVAKRELEAGQLGSALRQLSSCYNNPQISAAEEQQLAQVLDQVAGTVVYSTQHLLEPPYEVQPGERLEDISQRYNVPWQLLAKINGIDDPQSLRPGERLKVMRGPFSAVVSLEKRQLTLLLADGSYAGRFNIGVGSEQPPREGVYAVSDKKVNPVYQGRDRAIPADDANNPLGERWIGLGSDLAIHGTDRPENIGRTDLPGSISLSPRDVEDVFDILSLGSKVTIRR